MAAREVFADTSVIYACLDARDSHHSRAAVSMREIARAGRLLVTTDYVIAETVNLAMARRGRLVAERVLDLIEKSAGIRVEWIGVDRFTAAKAFFRKRPDHSYSFTDCTSFVVMHELKITDSLTTDHHFAEAGFRSILAE